MRRGAASALAAAVGLLAVVGVTSIGSSSLFAAAVRPLSTTTTTRPATGGDTTTTTIAHTFSGSVAGATEQYGYGSIAVSASIAAGHLSNVTVASLQTAESYSQSLAQQVIPMLLNEVLAAQSTQVNGVSGATYTSQAYLASLQSAIDVAGGL